MISFAARPEPQCPVHLKSEVTVCRAMEAATASMLRNSWTARARIESVKP